MNIKTLILLLVVLPSAGCNRHYDGVNELKEMVKTLQKEMHRFSVYECVNGKKSKPMPRINKIVEFQLGSARYEYQQSLNDGILSTSKNRMDAKHRIQKKIERSMEQTMVSLKKSCIILCIFLFQNCLQKYRAVKKHKSRRLSLYKKYLKN